MDATLIL